MKKIDFDKLKKLIGEKNVQDNEAFCYVYGGDSSVHEAKAWGVVRPECTEHVQEIIRYCNENVIPVVARGSGSGMSGQAVPIYGGLVLDMKRMNHILNFINISHIKN